MPLRKRYELIYSDTQEFISYANLEQTCEVFRRLLWKLYTDRLTQKITDRYPNDDQIEAQGEPAFLGEFEESRNDIRGNIRTWSKPQHWDIALRMTRTKIIVVSPKDKFLPTIGPFVDGYAGFEVGPLPTELPGSDMDDRLKDFFKHEELYMTDPDLDANDVAMEEFMEFFQDQHPDDNNQD